MEDNFEATRFMLSTSYYDENKAEYVISFIENLKHTKGEWHNKPFILLPWYSFEVKMTIELIQLRLLLG